MLDEALVDRFEVRLRGGRGVRLNLGLVVHDLHLGHAGHGEEAHRYASAHGLAVLLAIGQLTYGAPLAAAVLTVRPAQRQDGVHRRIVRQAQQRQHLGLAALPARGQHGAQARGVDAQQQVLHRRVDRRRLRRQGRLVTGRARFGEDDD